MISRGNPLGPELLREMGDRGILADAAIPVGPPIGSSLPEPALAPQISPVVGQQGAPNPLMVAQQAQQQAPQESGGGGILSGLGGLLGGGFSAPEGMNWKDLMFDAGVGMLTGQGDSFQKIGQGLAFARQSAAERRKAQQEDQRYEREFGLKERTADRQDALAEANLRKIEQDLETGSIMHLGNGILWNAATGERVAPELAEEVQRRAVQRAAASAAVGRSPGRYMKDDFYDQDGNLVPRRFNDRSGEFEYNVNGQWTNEPPEGLMRPTDSAMRDYMGIGASRIEEISASGEAAQDQLGTIREFNRVLDENPDLYTGAGANTINDLRRYALALGLPADQAQVASMDELKNLTMNLVMGRIQSTKGAISEREMEAFERSVPNIGQTPEGMRRVLGIMERGAERQIERGRFYERRAGRMPKWQIDEEWERYINANPVIEDLLPSSGGSGGRSTTTSTGVKWSLED